LKECFIVMNKFLENAKVRPILRDSTYESKIVFGVVFLLYYNADR
jgi:hypothetical protein